MPFASQNRKDPPAKGHPQQSTRPKRAIGAWSGSPPNQNTGQLTDRFFMSEGFRYRPLLLAATLFYRRGSLRQSLSPSPVRCGHRPPPPAAQGAVPAAVQGHRGGAAHGGRLRLVRATPGRVGLTCRSVLTVKPHRFLPDHHLSLGMACVSFIHTDRQTFSNIPPPCFLFLRHFESFPCSKPQWKKIFCSMPKAHFFHW